jgi:hypothetical protein
MTILILSLILVVIWSSVKLTINIGFRHFIQNYSNWYSNVPLIFNEMKRNWFNRKRFKFLDNDINEGVFNSIPKVSRLIEKNRFITDSLFH